MGLTKPWCSPTMAFMRAGKGNSITGNIEEVWEAYRTDLEQVEVLIHKNLDSDVPLLNQIAHYILDSGGKRIRPLLVIIAAKLCGYTGNQHILLANLVEFIHTATLLHDDVIDQGVMRRGKKSVRALWGNHASILVGDYFYVTAAAYGIKLDIQEVNLILLGACRSMIEGEMKQHAKHNDLDITDQDYLNIIQSKTASLISAACRMGAVIGKAPDLTQEAMSQFGLDLGMAFQVSDDTLDYTAEKNLLGKTIGKDLKEGKITLPLIHLLKNCTKEERLEITEIVKCHGGSKKGLEQILALMQRYGSINYTMERAQTYITRAKNRLDSCFGDSPHKHALQIVADYVVTRDR